MFLDYLALFILLLAITAVIYIFFAIHDIPHVIAKKRHHPHEEAIHVACWLSLVTLHALWPLVFIWAVSHKPHVDVTVTDDDVDEHGNKRRRSATFTVDASTDLKELRGVLDAIKGRVDAMEREQEAAATAEPADLELQHAGSSVAGAERRRS